MMLTDLPYMLSFVNASDIKLVNSPKLSVFVKFDKNQADYGIIYIPRN